MSKNYPDYVQNWLQENNQDNRYEISVISGGYYVYLRRQGNLSHQYVGVLKEDGLHERKPRKHTAETGPVRLSSDISPSPSSIETWEYGFTKAMIQLCPDSWKKAVGNQWEDALAEIILRQSPRSFLAAPFMNAGHFQYTGAARGLLEKMMGYSISDLYNALGGIILLCNGTTYLVSKVYESQIEFCKNAGLRLEGI